VEQLALKYRPTGFDDLVGQRAVNYPLRAMVEQDKVPTALLFKGSRGTGKTTTARILAAALNCEQRPGPCGQCVSCKAVFDGTSLDLVEIDAASNGLVDDIRALRQHVLYGVGGQYRVVVLDEAHSMSQAAFNALLKTLEEPPPGTVFILATTEPGRIMPTVRDRCMPFTFTRIGIADMTARLAHICQAECQGDVEPALLHALAEHADGSMRDAIMVLDQLLRIGITTLAGYHDLIGDADHGPALLDPITRGDIAAAYTTLDAILTRTGDPNAVATALAGTLRDLQVLRAGGQLAMQGEALAARTALAERLDPPAIFAAQTVLWDLRTKIRPGDDPRSSLDLAVAMIMSKLVRPAATAASSAAPAAARKLTLADMAALRR